MTAARRVAVVHFHLRPGGVASVIERAVRSLEGREIQAAVLCGSDPSSVGHAPVRVVPGLEYDARGDASDVADALVNEAGDALGARPDIFHFHNHSIGKSDLLPRVICELARRGHKLLLQIHDFAEDGRPGNYQRLLDALGHGRAARMSAQLYPDAAHIHYAAINLRDLSLLKSAGVAAGRAHYLPDCAGEIEAMPPRPEGPAHFIYPTRAIRRKNIGEFLLWSAISAPGSRWSLTLAPRSVVDRMPYDAWVKFASEQRLPVEFEAGTRHRWTPADLMREATTIVTTSVAEGFGLVFLDPWLAGRPLLGRNLPEITSGLGESGIDLSHLYSELMVPVEWIGREKLRAAVARGLADLFTAYGRTPAAGAVERAGHEISARDEVDFGRLNEELQRDVITRLISDKSARMRLQPRELTARAPSAEVAQRNRAAVLQHYSIRAYGDRLCESYSRVASSEPEPLRSLSSDTLLDGFLDPSRFTLLRT